MYRERERDLDLDRYRKPARADGKALQSLRGRERGRERAIAKESPIPEALHPAGIRCDMVLHQASR